MIITTLIYILLSFTFLLISGKISYYLNLVDIPNERKIHTQNTAYTGGISISLILVFAIILFDTFNQSLSLILSIGFLISIVGLIDDKYNLNIGGKLSLQIIPIFYLIFFEKFSLNNIGNYGLLSLDLGSLSIPFTFLSVLFLINAFNYFDGVDGTLCFTSISVLGILYFLSIEHHQHFLISDQNSQYFLVIIIIPILIFLLFNFSLFNLPKMFLGDSGSLLLGFVISFILIYFANQKLIEPIILAWSIAIFVYEFLSINIIRLINKQKLFKAGQDHMHHLLLRKFNSILITNTFIFLLNIALFLVGYFGNLLFNQLISLILFIIFFFIFFALRKKYSRKYI